MSFQTISKTKFFLKKIFQFRWSCKVCAYNQYAFEQKLCNQCPIGALCVDGILIVQQGIYFKN